MLFGIAFYEDHRLSVQSKETDVFVLLGSVNGPLLRPSIPHTQLQALKDKRLLGNSNLRFFLKDPSVGIFAESW
jgi:hypothetical protein